VDSGTFAEAFGCNSACSGRSARNPGEAGDVRDPVLSESLRQLAAEAATRFSSLVATGEQIPFDVAEDAGEDSPFYRYVPLTARFVAEREGELRSLPSFGSACGAVETAEVAAPYLEARGEPVPAEGGERAARMLVRFLSDLWEDCAEFSLDRRRLEHALHVLDSEARDVSEADVLIAPLIGLTMPPAKLQLPSGVRVVRADTVDAPIDAMRSEGMARAAWEPQFLALAEQGEGAESGAEALRQLRELISVMRLFKEGGVGLGPYAFAPTGEGNWRRVATGAPAPRAGGYTLTEVEAEELAALAKALEAQPDADGSLSWAIARFEMGCGRPTPLEGLSDHLLALRAVLEGHGPVGASLPMRAAALFAGDMDRVETREKVEHAMALERRLMSGAEPEEPELAVWVEEGVRSMLRDVALGELGADVGAAADDALITSGLAEGDGTMTEDFEDVAIDAGETDLQAAGPVARSPLPADWPVSDSAHHPRIEEDSDPNFLDREQEDEQPTRILEPMPMDDDEIRIQAVDREAPAEEERLGRRSDWLREVSRGRGETLEWPADEEGEERPPPQHRERIDTPRVRHLFPVPEDADWQVRELNYDRRRGSAAS